MVGGIGPETGPRHLRFDSRVVFLHGHEGGCFSPQSGPQRLPNLSGPSDVIGGQCTRQLTHNYRNHTPRCTTHPSPMVLSCSFLKYHDEQLLCGIHDSSILPGSPQSQEDCKRSLIDLVLQSIDPSILQPSRYGGSASTICRTHSFVI